MPSPEFRVSQLVQSIRYTGTNSSDIVTQFPGVTVFSESGGVVVLERNGQQQTANTGDWILYNSSSFMAAVPNNLYEAEWDCVAVCSDIPAPTSGQFVRSLGVAAVPTLLLGASTTVAVQIQPAMPDATYSAYASKFAGVSLVDLAITSVTVVDSDTVNVGVQNTGLVTLTGASVLVHAID